MFKVGDIVRIIDDKNKVQFIVNAIWPDDRLIIRVFKNSQPEPTVLVFNPVDRKCMEIDIDYYRKQKIKKICSKLEIE